MYINKNSITINQKNIATIYTVIHAIRKKYTIGNFFKIKTKKKTIKYPEKSG